MAIVNLTLIKPEINNGNHLLYKRLDTNEIISEESINILFGKPIKVILNKKPTIAMNHLDSEQKANAFLLRQKASCNSKNPIYLGYYCRIK